MARFKSGDMVRVVKILDDSEVAGGETYNEYKQNSKYLLTINYPLRVELAHDYREGKYHLYQPNGSTTMASTSDWADEELELFTEDKPMANINSMMKRLLDADTKKLVKANLINGDLLLTEAGKNALYAILMDKFKSELVKEAEDIISEEEGAK